MSIWNKLFRWNTMYRVRSLYWSWWPATVCTCRGVCSKLNLLIKKKSKMTKSSVVVVIFIICIMASFVRSYRQNAGPKKESHLKSSKSPRVRSVIFENLFIIYDPSFLSIVWPKIRNGVHVNVDRGCWDDLSVFFRALTEGHTWAYSSKYIIW